MTLENSIEEVLNLIDLLEIKNGYNQKRKLQKEIRIKQTKIRKAIAESFGWTSPKMSMFNLKQLASNSRYGAFYDFSLLDNHSPNFWGVVDFFKTKNYFPAAILNHTAANNAYITAYINTRLPKELTVRFLGFSSSYGRNLTPILITRRNDND